jgi:hypothetical protein
MTPRTVQAPADGPLKRPFLDFSQEESLRYDSLAKEQEAQLAACTKAATCDRIHFTLALIALGHDREAAAKHFETVHASNPVGALATPSSLWLELLRVPVRQHDASETAAHGVMTALVREYLDRELQTQTMLRQQRAAATAAFQQELKVKDKRIQSLSAQLEALKRIDEEMKEKTRPITQPPMSPSRSNP